MSFRYLLATALSMLIGATACTIAPKADYTRTHVDRPYTLPSDVAKVTFGAQHNSRKAEETISGVTADNSKELVTPLWELENGVVDSFTWIFPLGFKLRFYSDNFHSLGVSAYSLYVQNAFSVDYWLRLHENVSLRPFYRGEYTPALYFEEERSYYGGDLLFQLNDYWSWTFTGHYGKYSGHSKFFEVLLKDLIPGFDKESVVSGNYWSAGASTLISLSEYWDLFMGADIYEYDLGFKTTQFSAHLGLNYYW